MENGNYTIEEWIPAALRKRYGNHVEVSRKLEITPRTYVLWRFRGFKKEAQKNRAERAMKAIL